MRDNDSQRIASPTGARQAQTDAGAALQYINPFGLFRGSYVPEWLEHLPTISATAKLVYARLCRFAGKDGKAWPHEKTLARVLAVSERTIRAKLSELKRAGLIEIERKRIKGQPQNVYRFLLHPAMGLFVESESADRQKSAGSNRQGSSGSNRKESAGSYSSYEESQKLRESQEGKVLPLFSHQNFSRRSNEFNKPAYHRGLGNWLDRSTDDDNT